MTMGVVRAVRDVEKALGNGRLEGPSELERDENIRPDTSVEKLAKLKPVFGGENGTMTAGNSTPLSDGASTVLC